MTWSAGRSAVGWACIGAFVGAVSLVVQAALALIETSPLFLLPGRRCENGRPAPVGRADWQQYTAALVEAGRAAYKASQSRNIDAVIKVAEQLSATCDNCHK